MSFRILVLLLIICGACRSGEIACPDPVVAKLRKRPANYGLKPEKNLTASSKTSSKEKHFKYPEPKSVKSAASIEEWDCPKPGSKSMPKSVKDNIKKNRKKFDAYYKSKPLSDSTHHAVNRP
ncbi:MAG TPA: hypothetical protein VGD40_18645 [Chryseosolibacter sp.]